MLLIDVVKVPIAIALGVVAVVLTASVLLSLLFPPEGKKKVAAAPHEEKHREKQTQ